MNFFKINFRCIFFKIQRKVTEQTAAEAAVEVVLQHMMQHVKNIFRRRQHRIGLTVKRKGRCFQMIRRENLVHQLIRTGKLIDADDAVVQLKREGTVRVRERIAVGNVVVTVFRLLDAAMRLENPAGTGKSFFFIDIEIQISQLPVFGNRIIGGETDSF